MIVGDWIRPSKSLGMTNYDHGIQPSAGGSVVTNGSIDGYGVDVSKF